MPRSRVSPGVTIWEVLSGREPLRELKPDNRSVFDRIDIEDPLKPDYPVLTVDPTPNAATVIELFREYKVRIAEDNFSVLTGRIRPGTIAARVRQKRGMTYPSFKVFMYKARRIGLIHAIDELPLDRAGKPAGRLGNPGGLITTRVDPRTNNLVVVRARRVLYELTDLGKDESSWGDIGGSYLDLSRQLADERKTTGEVLPLEDEFTDTIVGKAVTAMEVPIRKITLEELAARTAAKQAATTQTTTPAIGEAPVRASVPAGVNRVSEIEAEPDMPEGEEVNRPDEVDIPDFDLPDRVDKRGVALLINHLGKLIEIGVGIPDVQVEIDDLTEQLDDWMNQIAEEKAVEESKANPNSTLVKELGERFEAISNALEQLKEYDPKEAVVTLREGFGIV